MKRLLIYQDGGDSISAIIAEKGEVYKDVTGKINKIDNKAPSHDSRTLIVNDKTQSTTKGRGGIVLQDVDKILSASQNQVNSGSRKDTERDDIVAINRDEAKEFAAQFGLNLKYIKTQVSPSEFFSQLKEAKDKFGLKIGRKVDDTNITSKVGQASFEANMAQVNALPTDDELFDNVFNLQEYKKASSDVNFNSDIKQYGGEKDFAANWFKQRAGYDINRAPINVSESTPNVDSNLRSKRPNSVIQGYFNSNNGKIVLNKGADNKDSTFLHEVSHSAQYNGLPNYDYQKVVPRSVMAEQIGDNPYLLDPKEVHSRLMQYRRDSGLQPTDVIDDSFSMDGDAIPPTQLHEFNTAKRQELVKSGKYKDYAIEPAPDKTLKETYSDDTMVQLLRKQGIRGDVPFSKLTSEQQRAVKNTQMQYDNKAAFDLFQENPDFENNFFKQKGVKRLRDPKQYNLPTDRKTLNTILNDLTAVEGEEDMELAQQGGSLREVSSNPVTDWIKKKTIGFRNYDHEMSNAAKDVYNAYDKQFPSGLDKVNSASAIASFAPNPLISIPANIINMGIDVAQGNGMELGADMLSSIMQYSSKGRTLANLFKGAGNMGDVTNSKELDVKLPKKEYGGNIDDVSMQGYRDDSPYRFNDSNLIQSNTIDMSQTGQPLMGISNTGDTKMLQPYSGITKFNGDNVTELALRKDGGDGDDGGRGTKYTKAQLDYIKQNNSRIAAQIQKGVDWLRNNPNADAETKTRIQTSIDGLKKDVVQVDGNQGNNKVVIKASDLPKGITKTKANITKTKAATTDPSELGEIPTDTIIKTGVTTAGSSVNPIMDDVENIVKVNKPFDVKINAPKLPDVKYTATQNPVAPPTLPSSFSDEGGKDQPRLPKTVTEIVNKDNGLKWYDVAGDFMSLIDAQNRTSPVLRQVDLPRVDLVRPSADPQVNAIRQNFLVALDSLKASDDTTGAANVNQLMTNANQQMQQAIAQGQQMSADVQNKEEIANQAIIADETIRNLALQEDFTKKVLMTDEAQRKQTLSSFQNIFDKIAKNERFNKTENAFQSVFAKNYKITDEGRIQFAPDDENNPAFYNNVAANILPSTLKQQVKKSVQRK